MSIGLNLSCPLGTVLDRLALQPTAWVRLAAARYEDSWEVEVCDIVTGAAPRAWKTELLIYPEAVLLATRSRGPSVVGWLKRGRARLAGRTLILPQLNPNPQIQRYSSNAKHYKGDSAVWPTVSTDLIFSSSPPANRQQPQQMLVAQGSYTFPNFATAARYITREEPKIDSTIYRRVSYRHQDKAARISAVEYDDENAWVSVVGEQLAGVTVEIMGASPGPARRIRRPPKRPVHMKLDGGLPRNAYVVLVREDECLDQRAIGWEYPSMQDPDVRRIVKFDPAARLRVLIWNKENDQVEFKQAGPLESDSDKETVMKTVAAYANGNGGSLFLGINKRYEATGVRGEEVPKYQDNLSDLIDDWVHPTPDWAYDVLPIPGSRTRVVVELIVQPGEFPPYGVGTMMRSLRYYVRHGARSVPARPDEVRALVRSRPPSEPPGGLSIFR